MRSSSEKTFSVTGGTLRTKHIKDFVLNDPRYSGCILVAGANFGSGSSREHAAWAIAGYGFRAVVSSSFADIHRNNELNSFVLPVQVSPDFLKKIFSAISADPAVRLRIDLQSQKVTLLSDGSSERFEISACRSCFENALDDIDYLLEHKDKIEEYETEHSKIAR